MHGIVVGNTHLISRLQAIYPVLMSPATDPYQRAGSLKAPLVGACQGEPFDRHGTPSVDREMSQDVAPDIVIFPHPAGRSDMWRC